MIKSGYDINESVINEASDKDVDQLKKILKREKEIEDIIKKDGFKGAMKYKDEYHKLLSDIGKLADKIDGPGAIHGKGILSKLSESVEVSESADMNESALKVSKCTFNGGTNRPFPDGSSKGDMIGSNKAVEVHAIYYHGDGMSGDYCVVMYFSDDDDEAEISKVFKTGKEAIKFAEKLLKEVNDPMLDGKKVAKKYGMDYND